METVQLQLDEQIVERARQLAASRGYTLAELVEKLIEQQAATAEPGGYFLGMFADEPDLVDQVVAATMRAREEHPTRSSGG